jgi:hypothetical protein
MTKKTPIIILLAAALAAAAVSLFTACPPEEPSSEKYAITFDANGGLFAGGKSAITVEDSLPRPIGADFPQAPAKDGCHFDNWWTSAAAGEGRQIIADTSLAPAAAAATVYARWLEVPAGSFVVTFYYNDGTEKSLSVVVAGGSTLGGSILAAPARGGYEFLGWFTGADTEYTAASVINADTDLYAKWQLAVRDDLDLAVGRAKALLGDLSTLAANLTLPASDDFVIVTWRSSNPAILSNTGVVSRPGNGVHAELTLTGTFTSILDTSVTETVTWPVRVLHSAAAFNDFLNVSYEVRDGQLINTAFSGAYYTPSLQGDASIDTTTAPAYPYIKIGTDGYIDLGPRVGALLLQNEWTIEFYVKASTNNTGQLLGFANDENIINTDASPWHGAVYFRTQSLVFSAHNNGANPSVNSYGDTAAAVDTGNSGGVGDRINRWMHVTLIKRGSYIAILRDCSQAQNDRARDFSRLSNSIFRAAEENQYPLRYGYLGRNIFANVSDGDANSKAHMNNTQYYGFKVYSKALVSIAGESSGAWTWDNTGTISQANAPKTYAKRQEIIDINAAFNYPRPSNPTTGW